MLIFSVQIRSSIQMSDNRPKIHATLDPVQLDALSLKKLDLTGAQVITVTGNYVSIVEAGIPNMFGILTVALCLVF